MYAQVILAFHIYLWPSDEWVLSVIHSYDHEHVSHNFLSIPFVTVVGSTFMFHCVSCSFLSFLVVILLSFLLRFLVWSCFKKLHFWRFLHDGVIGFFLSLWQLSFCDMCHWCAWSLLWCELCTWSLAVSYMSRGPGASWQSL